MLAFARTRTRILRAELDWDQPHRVLTPRAGAGLVFQSSWFGRTLDAHIQVDLDVYYSGEPPKLARVDWRGTLSNPIQPQPLRIGYALPQAIDPNPRSVTECQEHWQVEFQKHLVWAKLLQPAPVLRALSTLPVSTDIFDLRRNAIAEHASAQDFFLQLDRASRAESGSIWEADTLAINAQLDVRLQVRIKVGKGGESPTFKVLDLEDIFDERKQLERVSFFMNTLMVSTLYRGGDDLVDWAFELFATDRLDVPHRDTASHNALLTHGTPNGTGFFKFAELALFCIENGIHADFWAQHLETLVRTAQIFAEHGVERSIGTTYPFAETEYAFVEGPLLSASPTSGATGRVLRCARRTFG